MSDPVSPKLREIEKVIDNYHKANKLTTLPLGEAAWYLLATYEDIAFFNLCFMPNSCPSIHNVTLLADNIVVEMQRPLLWLWKSCPTGGVPPQKYNEELYKEANNLIDLARSYDAFYLAFTYASRGWARLELRGNTIVSCAPFLSDPRYEAYSRLIQNTLPGFIPAFSPPLRWDKLVERVEKSIRISGERFRLRLGRRIVEEAIALLAPAYNLIFELPTHWHFPHYSLAEFHQISKFLIARSFLQQMARCISAFKGIKGAGYPDSLIVIDEQSLYQEIAYYANCGRKGDRRKSSSRN